jgi:prepilin-type N-terminal cleavage/methylation domain-containing protein
VKRGRAGFSLVEALIAVVILGAMAGGLATMLVKSGKQARDTGKLSYRAAVLNAEVSRVTAIPAGNLADGTVTRTVTGLPLAYTLTTVTATSGTTQTVTITLTPTGANPIGALTRVITRKAGSTNPFGS